MSNNPTTDSLGSSLGGCLVLLVLLLWVGSCVFDGPSEKDKEQAARAAADQRLTEARRSADIARYRDDPLLVESARKSPSGDAVSYAISALGGQCGRVVSVTPLRTPMLYEVICSEGSTGGRLNFIKYRLNTASGISELVD